MMTNDKSKFWEEHWQAIIDQTARYKPRQEDNAAMRRWNKMAADFAQRTSDRQADESRVKTMQWLKDQGALTPDSRVLDIGAGPGSWAVLLAETAAHVTALEPADAMVDILEARIGANNITNITVVRRTWQSVDLAAEGWEKHFDLVFASMTPGIDGPVNLRKMIAASRGYCYHSAFSGRGPHHWDPELWQALFKEAPESHPGDIIHRFNLVYALGYRPEMRFNFRHLDKAVPRDQAIDDICVHLEAYTDLTEKVKAAVTTYVDERCQDGVLSRQRKSCQGVMVWSVNEKVVAD